MAALYVDPRGPYMNMEGVDPWPESRDAKLYAGPDPVVAHPPCGPWGRLSWFCTKQDASCGPRAVEQVQTLGGVLEHPEFSSLWRECNLPELGEFPDQHGGRTVTVDQVWWGHKCRKRTWLYVVGVGLSDIWQSITETADLSAEPTHVISTTRGASALPELTIKRERALTPPAFAEWLVSLARSSTK